jgi:signal peptidase I
VIDEPVRPDSADRVDREGTEPGALASMEAVQPARGGSHRKHKARPPRKQRPFWIEAVVLLAIALGIALVVHTFLFQAFFIPSGSMENTLHVGDRVLVNRLSYKVGHVQRGQIVVNGEDSWTPEATTTPPSNPVSRAFRDVGSFLGFAPAGEKDFIKRVIGVPGDHVVCCDSHGRITVNGTPLNETYLAAGPEGNVTATTTQVNAGRPFDITVPPGRLWVEGDHRDDSADSRSHTGEPGGGTIPENKVIGRAFVIVWPIKHMRGLGIPSAFHGVANATAAGLPYGLGGAAVLPVLMFRRRRSRAGTSST